MKKILVLSLFIALVVGFNINYVSAQETSVEGTIAATLSPEITSSDLGVENPGMLPTSPFYFLKNWGRTIKRVITIDPVKKANLELEIANQQAAEINRMKEVSPERIDSIAKAAENYQSNVEKLKTRLEGLKETSKNPNVDKLLENLADRSIKHQQLFDELKKKFEDKPELKQRFGEMQDKMNEALIKIPEKFDSPEAFKERMKRAIEARPDSPFREIRGMEMMEKIEGKLPEDRRAGFEGVKNDLMKKFGERVNAMPEDAQKAFMAPQVLERMPGDPELRAKILEEMQGRMQLPPEMEKRMEEMQRQILEKAVKEGDITKEKVEDAITRAEKSIEDLKATPSQTVQMKNLLDLAKKHLDEAKAALAISDYGKAFGLAISADRIARNGLMGNILFKTQLAPLPKLMPLPGTNLPLKSSLFPEGSVLPTSSVNTAIPSPLSPTEQIVCTQEYRPVCGNDGKTYPNLCYAKVANIMVVYPGICKAEQEL